MDRDGQPDTPVSWQAIMAALASSRLRELYAAFVLGQQPALSAKERQKLLDSSLLNDDGGRLVVNEHAFKAALAGARRPEPEGAERFLLAGRIEGLPKRATDRLKLFEFLIPQIIGPDATLTEKQLNAKLAAFTDDVPLLRRALVDYGYLDRERDGSAYHRAR
ncbi:DUF2087 domain-containing protein [Arthrobacter crystallopoietes]|uniref:DUF2087 domain-containing protein n=1 Tax=Crystallibacter crystallopoietes TaxID=37928 RepID=A0A1H0Z9T1_9MICC|nr:DUF2087 domain-containing protein [Arthrobacter crystallopoietes]AUI52088.1 hypothetical protein AC20117_16145 [Arthrobacter crystallopoietes]SDQ24130.1 hypothetical protein SAMN04489742_0222 [Arthrobacter crystallopoietes]